MSESNKLECLIEKVLNHEQCLEETLSDFREELHTIIDEMVDDLRVPLDSLRTKFNDDLNNLAESINELKKLKSQSSYYIGMLKNLFDKTKNMLKMSPDVNDTSHHNKDNTFHDSYST